MLSRCIQKHCAQLDHKPLQFWSLRLIFSPKTCIPEEWLVGSRALICTCFFFFTIFIYLTVLGLRYCTQAFSSCGHSPVSVHGLLIVMASLIVEQRLQGERASEAVAHGLMLCACGIFLDQGSNLCSLRWQADSYPLGQQGSPRLGFLKKHSSLRTTQEQEQGLQGPLEAQA